MLRVEMIIDNQIASTYTPYEYVKKEILKESNTYKLLDLKVTQGDNLKLNTDPQLSHIILENEYLRLKSEIAAIARSLGEFCPERSEEFYYTISLARDKLQQLSHI